LLAQPEKPERREMQERPFPRYLTSAEVAAACGVSPRTVTNWMREGAIASHRTVGGHGRVSAEELRRFLVERRMPVPASLTGEGAPEASRPVALAPRRRRALVIDDDEAFLEVVRELLTSSGWDVELAQHGFLAGFLVGRNRPDVVLLDLRMPGLDGYEVLSLMRRDPEARSIPVLACTSLRGADAEARIRAAGFHALVRKPVDFRALLALLDETCR
jgi:excisionase family DNA binding protein